MQSEIIWAILFGSLALLAQFLSYRIGLPVGFSFVLLAVWQLYLGAQVSILSGSLIVLLAALMVIIAVKYQRRISRRASGGTVIGLAQRLPQRHLTSKRRLNADEREWAYEFRRTMRIQHGHEDNDGVIEQELLDGYTGAEISIMPCQKCGRPRDEEGKDVL